jgi:signal recognition particle GTPase
MTDQPRSRAFAAAQIDDITTFLGPIPADEHAARSHIKRGRDFATFKVRTAESADARQFLWILIETAGRWLFEPASVETLQQVGKFLSRCAVLAEQAEELETDHAIV